MTEIVSAPKPLKILGFEKAWITRYCALGGVSTQDFVCFVAVYKYLQKLKRYLVLREFLHIS